MSYSTRSQAGRPTGTLSGPATARPDPLPRMCQAGRKARNGAGCTADQAAAQDAVVTSRPSTFDFSTSKTWTNDPRMSMKTKDRCGKH